MTEGKYKFTFVIFRFALTEAITERPNHWSKAETSTQSRGQYENMFIWMMSLCKIR